MTIQIEDIYHLLSFRCFNVDYLDFMLIMDKSRRHPRIREGTLKANHMSVRYGGRSGILRETKIRYVGTYPVPYFRYDWLIIK